MTRNTTPVVSNLSVLRPEYESFAFSIDGYASVNDSMPAWNTDWRLRDKLLRMFWPTQTTLASTLFGTAIRYSGFGWQLKGPPKLVTRYTDMLNNVEAGQGWEVLWTKVLVDVFSQDNGGFIEIVRVDNSSPTSEVVTLNHLDANRCARTGDPLYPVVYENHNNKLFRLAWWQVMDVTDCPSPVLEARGRQYCAVTRVLLQARMRKDIDTYLHERVAGRFSRGIHIVSGITRRQVDDLFRSQNVEADQAGLTRFMRAGIINTVDPNAVPHVEELKLATLPEGYDAQQDFERYITELALAFGIDAQDIAPFASKGLTSGASSDVLHLKSRGKGPRYFQTTITKLMNFRGLFPQSIEFIFGEQDVLESIDLVRVSKIRAETREIQLRSGEIDRATARELAVEAGDLTKEQADAVEDEQPTEGAMNSANGAMAGNNNDDRSQRDGMDRDDPTRA